MKVKSVALQGYIGLLNSVSQLLEPARYAAVKEGNG